MTDRPKLNIHVGVSSPTAERDALRLGGGADDLGVGHDCGVRS